MFDNLLSGITGGNGGGADLLGSLQQKFGLSQEQAAQTLPVAQESVTETLKAQALGGNMSGIMGLFGGETPAEGQKNELTSAISGNMLENLVSKVGLPESIASKISVDFLPQVLGFFQGKAKDENGNVSQTGIMSMLSGGNLGDVLGGLKDKLGGFF